MVMRVRVSDVVILVAFVVLLSGLMVGIGEGRYPFRDLWQPESYSYLSPWSVVAPWFMMHSLHLFGTVILLCGIVIRVYEIYKEKG